MLKTNIFLFLILHLIGDIYLKQKKAIKYQQVMITSVIYLLLLCLPVVLLNFNLQFLILALILSITNFILNTISFFIKDKSKNKAFIIIQIIQIALIVCLNLIFKLSLKPIINVNITYIKWALALLLVGKPSNLIFKNIFTQYKPVDNQTETFKNAGATIGTLERILILICLVNDLHSSIGLILTAKSIARYNRISEEKEFSEYYLLGTLSSVLFTIIIYVIAFNI